MAAAIDVYLVPASARIAADGCSIRIWIDSRRLLETSYLKAWTHHFAAANLSTLQNWIIRTVQSTGLHYNP